MIVNLTGWELDALFVSADIKANPSMCEVAKDGMSVEARTVLADTLP